MTPGVYDVRDFGALGDDTTDDADAFEAAFAAMRAASPANPSYGATLIVPPGRYRVSRPVRPQCSSRIVGEGAGGPGVNAPSSIVRPDAGVHGIILDGWGDPQFGRADGTLIQDLAIWSRGKSAPASGILARCSFHLSRVHIMGFAGHGVDAYGSIESGGSSVNQWTMHAVAAVQCGGAGFRFVGPDANAGCATGCDASDCDGGGFLDHSFLGNTWVGCHCEINGVVQFETVHPTTRSVFVGCYSEEGTPPSKIQKPSMVLGGIHGAGNSGDASLDTAGLMSPRQVPAVIDANARAYLDVGTSIGGLPGAYLHFRPSYDHSINALSLRYDDVPNANSSLRRGPWTTWSMYGGVDLMALPMVDGTSRVSVAGSDVHVRAREPVFPLGLRRGASALLEKLEEGGHAGFPIAGTFNVGDEVIFKFPVDDYTRARCVKSGTAGTYAEGRTATSNGGSEVVLSGPSSALRRGDALVIGSTPCRVVSIAGTSLAASVSIPGGSALPIVYDPPAWRRFGKLE